MRSRSGIVGACTTVALGIDAVKDGAHSLQSTAGTNSGGTAGEEEDVSVFYIYNCLLINLFFLFGNFLYCILLLA